MITTTPSLCRLVVADRASQRFSLANVIRAAGFAVKDPGREIEVLRDLGLLEMDVLFEIEDGKRCIADFFPAAFQLKSWKAFLCANILSNQPTLVLSRTEGQDPSKTQAANQEIVTLLHPALSGPHFAPPPAAGGDTVSSPPAQASAEKSLAGLASEVAHDINNLLTIIRGNCHLLLHNPVLAEGAHELIREINKAGEQTALLTQYLSAACRSEEPRPQVVDLHELLANYAGMLRSLLGNRHELMLRLDTQRCPVSLVAGHLERILINLTANAREAMPNHGTLTITTAVLDFDPPMALSRTFISGPYVLLTVSDSGMGLDERQRARLWQPQTNLGQGQFKLYATAGGKGLGLTIVANLIQKNHGHIEVHSQPGLGTSFHIFLPRVPSEASPVAEPVARTAKRSETVLLVEDEPMVRSIFRRILQDNGFVVLEAANGADAILLAQQFPYPIHLLITDLSMPLMNGIDLARHMTSLHPETQVLFLSGYSDGILPGTAPRDQAIAFLQKPFKAEALLQKVREILG